MHLLDKKNNRYVIAAATLFTLAIIAASSMAAPAAAAATITTSNTTTTTTTSTSSSGIELSPQPIFQDQVRGISQTPINQTHTQLIVAGNGTLTLPNGTEIINTTSTGSLIVSMKGTTATAAGKEILTTEEDGSENATATLYEIARFNMQDGSGKGIAIAVVHTNSTGKLAPLDGMILTGQEEFRADGSRLVAMWEWKSGIPLPPITVTTEEPPVMNTTTMTNATAA